MKRVFSIVMVLLISVLALETLLGYYFYQKRQLTKYSSLSTVGRWIVRRLRPNIAPPHQDQILVNSQEINPFLDYDKGAEYKFHPLLDFTDVHGKFPPQIKLDYFGFRNDTDLYFDDAHDYRLVVLTGGSEAAGYCHKTTIAQNLEKILNKDGHRKYKVLNLAMNGYSVSNEINAYLHLAYSLRPDIVISHSGWNDLTGGQKMPYNFKRLGLVYLKNLEQWLPRLYKLQDADAKYEEDRKRSDPRGNDLIAGSYLRNLKKYRNVVETNGGKFIIGLQRYERIPDPEYDEAYRAFPEVAEALHGNEEFIDFTHDASISLCPGDAAHTDDGGSLQIAKVYADRILKRNRSDTP